MPRPAPRYANPASFKVGHYNEQHRKNLSIRAKKVERLYRQAVQKIAAAAQPSLFGGTPGQEFSWRDFPALSKEVDALTREMTQGLQLNIEQGDKEAWALSNTKNNAMVAAMVGKASVPKAVLDTWKAPNLAAMNAFIARKEAGMNLSQRVWNLAPQFKAEMELALETCIGRGMSAAEISREVRQYLNEPNRLFRRVRDEQGVLRLSKAAAAYHPGQGVYRSSYKNAIRMTATENNIAYRTADHGRWNALPFVLGIEISTSNNHPVEDICDELAGRYPKDFKFTGWHPWCRCFAVAVLADQKEMDAYTKAMMNGDDVSQWKFTGEVKDMPEGWNTWMTANAERIGKARSAGKLPYFIKDNFTDGDPTKGLRWKAPATTTPAKPKKLTPQEIAAQRHAARTQKEVQAIKEKWNERRRIRHLSKETLELASQYKAIDKFSIGILETAYKEGNIPGMRMAARYLRKSLVPLRRAELELQRIERRMLADGEITTKQQAAINRRIRMTREYLRNETDILDIQGHGTPIGIKGLKSRIDNILNWFKPKAQKPAKKGVTGYTQTQAAKDYEARKAAWPYKENYHLETTEERTLRDGNKYKCDIYTTPGGTKIVVPRNLPKTYHITVKDLADELEKLPVELKAQTKEIHLVNFLNPDDAYWKKKYKTFTQSYATGGNGTITFYKTPKGWTQADGKADLPFTLSHENGHNVDRYMENLKGQRPSETQEWKDAMAADKAKSGKESMRAYGQNSTHEDFADAFGYFVDRKSWFKKNFPERYKIISRIIGIP